MAKGWTTIETVNTIKRNEKTAKQKYNDIRKREKMINSVQSLSVEQLKDESAKLYYKNRFEEDSLVDAFDNKILKSKNAIKQALRIKKKRASKKSNDKSADQNTEKVSNKENETTEKTA